MPSTTASSLPTRALVVSSGWRPPTSGCRTAVRIPAEHRTRSVWSVATSRSLQRVPHPGSGPYCVGPYRGPHFSRCGRPGRDQPHQRHRRLAHLLHRHAPAVAQVLVLAARRDVRPCTAPPWPSRPHRAHLAAWRGRGSCAGCPCTVTGGIRSPSDTDRAFKLPLATFARSNASQNLRVAARCPPKIGVHPTWLRRSCERPRQSNSRSSGHLRTATTRPHRNARRSAETAREPNAPGALPIVRAGS
jgi:hypothetical protein